MGNFLDFDAVTFDKDGLYVSITGKDFQKLITKTANTPRYESVVNNFSQ